MATNFEELIKKGMMPNPQERLGYLIWQINMQWVRKVNHMVSEFDITHTQLLVLVGTRLLGTSKEEVIQQDLVELIKIDRMLVSKMVKKNVEAGFLRKKSSDKDSRVNVLEITRQGQKKMLQILPKMMQADEEFYGLLGEETKDLLTKLLQNFLARIEEHMNQSKPNKQ